MFGYVVPHIPMLRVQEFDTYKSVYCGLCRTLSKHYGPFARFTLSYDFTFVTMLMMAVNDTSPTISPRRCPFNPTKKMPHLEFNKELDAACNIAIIMLHFKCRDNELDSSFPKSLLWKTLRYGSSSLANSAGMCVEESFPIIEHAMDKQYTLEKEANLSLDQIADPTAHSLGELFRHLCEKPELRPILYRLGYMIGRYVYICDAIDDLEKDKATGSYNPFALSYDQQVVEETLYLTLSQITLAYQLLDIYYFKEILDNIIYLGLATKAKELMTKHQSTGGLIDERSV